MNSSFGSAFQGFDMSDIIQQMMRQQGGGNGNSGFNFSFGGDDIQGSRKKKRGQQAFFF